MGVASFHLETAAQLLESLAHPDQSVPSREFGRPGAIVARLEHEDAALPLQPDPEILGAGVADSVGDDLLYAAEESMGAGRVVKADVLGDGEVDAGPRHRPGERGQRGPEVECRAFAERAHRRA